MRATEIKASERNEISQKRGVDMTTSDKNDLYFVCSIIEFLGCYTKNRNWDAVKQIGKTELERQLASAQVSHCLTFEEVVSDLIDFCHIQTGDFDSVGTCQYKVPSATSIGKVYRDLILDMQKEGQPLVDALYEVFTSFISDAISNFNSSAYYENPSYLKHSYLQGYMLD